MGLEVEARFRATDPEVLSELARLERLGPAQLGPPATVSETDRYLDTSDGRLAAARWACRLRHRDGVTILSLKGPPESTDDAWHHRRPEVEGPATPSLDPATWPPGAARDRLMAMAGGHPLRERFALAQRRTERTVHVDGAAVGTLSLDAVRVLVEALERGRFEIVELELHEAGGGAEEHLVALAAALAAIPGLRPEPRTKLELAVDRIATS
ncbi:MAG TPA: CYTH domain-containing protein [Candidatus Limnocylindria bacterium]|nr:CYTH domain-containing protein [Candidatus Limnocylindria bacterium]